MTVSRSQILIGVAEFIQRDVIGSITDVPLKLILGAVAYRMRFNPDSFDSLVFDNTAAKVLLVETGGGYDLDATLNGVLNSLQSYGSLTITVPAIPLISKTEKALTFNAQDVERLKQMIADGGAH